MPVLYGNDLGEGGKRGRISARMVVNVQLWNHSTWVKVKADTGKLQDFQWLTESLGKLMRQMVTFRQ